MTVGGFPCFSQNVVIKNVVCLHVVVTVLVCSPVVVTLGVFSFCSNKLP